MEKRYNAAILLTDGFEEAEAIVPADILRRAGIDVTLISVDGRTAVRGSHNITIAADALLTDTSTDETDVLLLPGGPGAKSLMANETVRALTIKFAKTNRWIAAICAAPMIPGDLGLLSGREATCYPGYEIYLKGAHVVPRQVVVAEKIITANGAGAAYLFAFTIVAQLMGNEAADNVAKKMMTNYL